MTIKHLVLSGGGPTGFLTYGAARFLSQERFWQYDDIETIYGTSIGGFMGVVLSLGYEWSHLDDYFIKRPWEKVVDVNPRTILDAFSAKGVLGEQFIHDSLEPLLSAKGLSGDTTLEELYDHNKIDIHIYTTAINQRKLKKIDMSHASHPELTVVKAIAMSTAYPFAFKPVCLDDECYIDGGLVNNYPLRDCIGQTKCKESEVLAFKNIWVLEKYAVGEESSMFDFMLVLIRKMQREIDTEESQGEIANTVRCLVEDLDGFPAWMEALGTEGMRRKLIDRGSHQGKLFLSYIRSQGGVEELRECV